MKVLYGLRLRLLVLVVGHLAAPSLAFVTGSLRRGDIALHASRQPHVIIVGKVIVDEYGDPSQDSSPNVTVGGGGPQAAIGAALALATRSYISEGRHSSPEPPPQPVAMIGPVGDDFSIAEEEALFEILRPALQSPPRYFRGQGLLTPRIRLWHDEHQVLQWYALNDSFGESGAAKLWGSLPTVDDYLEFLGEHPSKPILHIISEGGLEAPGKNGCSKPLLDSNVRDAISFLGVEPILFPNEGGRVSEEDASHCANLMQRILDATHQDKQASVVLSPDMAAFQAMNRRLTSNALDSWAVRNGPQGSHIHQQSTASSTHIPSARLRELVNPTGAGNAYSAAYTTLRGSGCDAIESACIATGVGAVLCEYEHCPPYTWEVIERVAKASQQVKDQVLQKKAVVKQ